MIELTNFIGCVCIVDKFHLDQNGKLKANILKVLGTGFVVNTTHPLFLTNYHVLPIEDRKVGEIMFMVLRRDPQTNKIHTNGWLIDLNSIERWEDKDLIAFTCAQSISEVERNLRTYPICADPIYLGMQSQVFGLPKNHFKIPFDEKNIIIRCLTSFVVTGFDNEAELDKPFITGMSGGPIFNMKDQIIGIACKNTSVGLELFKEESIELKTESEIIKKETYRYKENIRFGVMYRASSFKSWLDKLI